PPRRGRRWRVSLRRRSKLKTYPRLSTCAYKAITSSVKGVLARRRGERDEVRRGAERHPLRSKPQDDLPRGACALLKSAPRPTAVTIGSPLSPVHYPKEMKNEKSAWHNRRRIRGISCMAQSGS